MKIGLQTFLMGVGALMAATFLFAEDIKTTTGVVTASRLNVRGRPLGTAEICCQIEEGDKVEILERKMVQTIGTTSEEWARIVLPEKATVWLQSSFLGADGVIQKRTDGRAGPTLMWPILCKLVKGDKVSAKTNHLDWTGIVPPRTASAWVAGAFISNIIQDATAVPPVSAMAVPESSKAESIGENKEVQGKVEDEKEVD